MRGTGPKGRLLKGDVLAAIDAGTARKAAATQTQTQAKSTNGGAAAAQAPAPPIA